MAADDLQATVDALNRRLAYATDLITSGAFAKMREHTGMSKRHQAEVLGVSGPTLRAWEAGDKVPVRKSLFRIADGFDAMDSMVRAAQEEGVDWAGTIPMSQACMILGRTRASIVEECERGELDCYDLGILGVWVAVGAEVANRCRQTKATREDRIAAVNRARKDNQA